MAWPAQLPHEEQARLARRAQQGDSEAEAQLVPTFSLLYVVTNEARHGQARPVMARTDAAW